MKNLTRLSIMAKAAIFGLNLTLGAEAHDWYPDECCHAGDCQHAPSGAVQRVAGGYLVKRGLVSPKGSVLARDVFIPYLSDAIRPFPPAAYLEKWGIHDGDLHICSTATAAPCLYREPGEGM